MPNDTNLNKKKKAPIICAVIMIGFLSLVLGAIVYPILNETNGKLAAIGIIIVYGLFILATIVGVFIALKQRLREIESGEEEDAKIY